MPDEYRVTIRLSPDLYAQLEACGSQGQPLAAIVRDALVEYLARQPEQPGDAAAPALTLAAMAARVAELHVQMQDVTARLDALAAERQPGGSQAATRARPSP
jgi:predicted transcriptional regulator